MAGFARLFYTAVSDSFGDTAFMDAQSVVRLVAGILAVVLVVFVIMRRKGKKKEEDEF